MNKKYQKLTQREHVLAKPEMYIGNVEKITNNEWVVTNPKQISKKNVSYSPGLLKIFDEIISNAQDEYLRNKKIISIQVDIDIKKSLIYVMNIGSSIPIEYFEDTKSYIPTVIFGEFLTSSNYNENEKKTTIGTFGIGAKATNVYSTMFKVETYDKNKSLLFEQTWKNNMSIVEPPIINKKHCTYDYTRIIFQPDLKRFNTQNFDEDLICVLQKRVYDLAGLTPIQIVFNKNNISCNSFKDYISYYRSDQPIYEEQDNVKYGLFIGNDLGDQISFVNGNITSLGGTHIDYFYQQIIKTIKPKFDKKNKTNITLKTQVVKNNMLLFLNCNVTNPKFSGQTKNQLFSSYNNKYTFGEKFIKNLLKSGLIESILNIAIAKENNELIKISGKKTNKISIPKLNDADKAGSKDSMDCILILTEGDSAKSSAVSGVSSIKNSKEKDKYGIFPLRGKMLNVREAPQKQILKNQEINNLIQILGLDFKNKYETKDEVKKLRYGKIMLMTDQDQDGSHIKGLVINFIHVFWPNLLKHDFFIEFNTPIIKAFKKNKNDNSIKMFYTIHAFEQWLKEDINHHKYNIKYYKGLGTSVNEEMKQYFSNLSKHRYNFIYKENDDKAIIKAFSKKAIEQRKEWLSTYMSSNKQAISEDAILYNRVFTEGGNQTLSYTDFIDKDLIHYSNTDNIRSIPNIMDGFKPGQRKIIYVMLNLKNDTEIKVERLAGQVSADTSYHHGEQSLKSTIINLAHDYVGTNNINLLQPNGQFGTRLDGGKDAASPRYIFTQLSSITKYIFIKDDNYILKFLTEENQQIEPEYFMPIIPMLLINGSRGIGTAWATNIPNFNPIDIINELLTILTNIKNNTISKSKFIFKPWYKGFKGDIVYVVKQNLYLATGIIYIDKQNHKVLITELPINVWTNAFEEKYLKNNDDVQYKDLSNEQHICFLITFTAEKFNEILNKENGMFKYFKLATTIRTNKLTAFDNNHSLVEYTSPNKILDNFISTRLKHYVERKKILIKKKNETVLIVSNQLLFITEICNNELQIEKLPKSKIVEILIKKKYNSDPRNNDEKDFDYLIRLPIESLSYEKLEELNKKYNKELHELNELKNIQPHNMWVKELNILKTEYINLQTSYEEQSKFVLDKNIKIQNYTQIKYQINLEKESESCLEEFQETEEIQETEE